MEIKNVVVAGGGVLGSQIALQSAYKAVSYTHLDVYKRQGLRGRERRGRGA